MAKAAQFRHTLQLSGYPLSADDVPFSLTVDWGDNSTKDTIEELTAFPLLTHDYTEAGDYKASVTLTNPCGSANQIVYMHVLPEYQGEDYGGIPAEGIPIKIISITPAADAAYNIPPMTVKGVLQIKDITDTVNDPLTLKYGVVLTLVSNLELHRYIPNYMEIVPSDTCVSIPDNTGHSVEHLEYAWSQDYVWSQGHLINGDYQPGLYATIAGNKDADIIVKYYRDPMAAPINVVTEPWAINTYTVTLYGSLSFLNRVRCPVEAFMSVPEVLDPVPEAWNNLPFQPYKATFDFNGEHIYGFRFSVALDAENPERIGYWLDTAVQILPELGDSPESRDLLSPSDKLLQPHWMDIHEAVFIENGENLLYLGTSSDLRGYATVYPGTGTINLTCVEKVAKIEMITDAAGKNRIQGYHSVRPASINGLYLLTWRMPTMQYTKRSVTDGHTFSISILDGEDAVIRRMTLFSEIPHSQASMPVRYTSRTYADTAVTEMQAIISGARWSPINGNSGYRGMVGYGFSHTNAPCRITLKPVDIPGNVALGYSVRIRCGVASYSEGYGKFYVSTAADTEIDRNKSVTYYGPYSGTTADVRNLTFTYNNLTGGEHYIDLEYYQLYWYSSTGDFNYGYLDSIEVRYAGQDEWKTLTMQQEERTVEVDVINDQVYYLANNDYGVYNTMVVKDVFLNVPPLEYLEGTARLETVYGDVYVQFTAGEPPVSGSDPNPLISADDPRLSLVNQ